MDDPDLLNIMNSLLGQDPTVDAILNNLNPDYGYGKRSDGSNKGRGYFGPLNNPNGGVSTELSVGVNMAGQEQEIPLLVPTLNKDEIQTVLSSKNIGDIPHHIIRKAQDHAALRMMSGKSPFAQFGEEHKGDSQ